jgi:ATP-binding cassette subfamily B multidrug efflux pump
VNSVARTSTCGARIFALLDLQPAVSTAPDAPAHTQTEGTQRLDHVSFAYPSAPDHLVLHDISFTAHRGEVIGIIGEQGSGKTTVAQLIPRFYDVTGGSITLDGQDIREVTLPSVRKAVAVVTQDVFMFTTTMENNIAYGNPWAPEAGIETSSSDAQLHDYIDALPERYRTVVGERGASLSGGQRQRMSIARSLILDPAVLIFDDSTAAIDARTEERIFTAIRAKAASRVTILIAHRLNTLMHADRILVLDGGRIAEQGTHAELLAQDGLYAEMWARQQNEHEDPAVVEANG